MVVEGVVGSQKEVGTEGGPAGGKWRMGTGSRGVSASKWSSSPFYSQMDISPDGRNRQPTHM